MSIITVIQETSDIVEVVERVELLQPIDLNEEAYIGPPGPGVPVGGLTDQVLVKNSNTNFDTRWETRPKITVGTSAPVSPAVNDLWVDTN